MLSSVSTIKKVIIADQGRTKRYSVKPYLAKPDKPKLFKTVASGYKDYEPISLHGNFHRGISLERPVQFIFLLSIINAS